MAEPARKEAPSSEPRVGTRLHLLPHAKRPYALRIGWALEGLTPIRRAEILESLSDDAFLQLLEETGVTDDGH